MPIPLGLPALAATGASLFGGMSQNAANKAEATKARQFNAAEAQKNRDFQAEMSNSAYQRTVADMRAAGINPMLAYQKGGASTPGGSSASGPSARMENVTSGAVNSAMAAKRLSADLKIAQHQARAAKAQADLAESTNYSLATTRDADGVLHTTMGPGLWPHLTDRANAETALMQNRVPQSQAMANFFGGVGQYAPYAAAALPMLGMAGRGGGAALKGGSLLVNRATRFIRNRRIRAAARGASN